MTMKTTITLLIFTIILKCIVAWVGIIPPTETDPENKAHCYSTSYNIGSLAAGERKSVPGECIQVICGSNKFIDVLGCGAVGTAPPCYVTKTNVSKPYPDCCPTVACPEDNKI